MYVCLPCSTGGTPPSALSRPYVFHAVLVVPHPQLYLARMSSMQYRRYPTLTLSHPYVLHAVLTVPDPVLSHPYVLHAVLDRLGQVLGEAGRLHGLSTLLRDGGVADVQLTQRPRTLHREAVLRRPASSLKSNTATC